MDSVWTGTTSTHQGHFVALGVDTGAALTWCRKCSIVELHPWPEALRLSEAKRNTPEARSFPADLMGVSP